MAGLRLKVREELPGLLVVACVSTVYLALVPPFVLGGDNGEFAALAHAQGIAHPPGYPLYVSLLRLLRWLPAATPVQAAGYATALMAGAQMLLCYLACRCWRISAWAAAIAVAFYAGSPLAVQHLTHAEVFALNGAIVAMILALCSPSFWLPASWNLVGLGLLCGLGLAHHHSFVLLAPLIVVGVINACSRLDRGRFWPALTAAMVALLVGFSPNFLLFPWSQADGVYLQSWGVVENWHHFWHHFFRADYGTLSLSLASSSGSHWGQHMLNMLAQLNACWKFMLPLSVLAFAVHLRRFGVANVDFWAWLGLLLSFLAAGPVFFSRANIDPLLGAPAMEVVQRFYLLPTQLLLLPVAEGLRLLVRVLRSFSRPSAIPVQALDRGLSLFVSSAVALYALGFNALISLRQTVVARQAHTQNFIKNGLGSLPFGAVVVVRADDEMYAGSYLQEVEHFRPDLVLVNTSFLLRPWYVKRLAHRLSGCHWPKTNLEGFFEFLVSSCERDLFINLAEGRTESVGNLYRKLPSYQHGLYRHVLAKGSRVPAPDAVFRLNQRLFDSFSLAPRPVSLSHGWASRPGFVYAEVWKRIARDMAAAGRSDLADSALQLSRRYGYCSEGACLSD